MSEKNDVIIQKIIKYCDKIEELLSEIKCDKKEYINKSIYQLSTDMCVYQIGELSIHVSEDFKEKHIEIPWAKMRGMRNIHAHEYDAVDRDEMWNTLMEDIPSLKKKLEKIRI